MKIILNVKKSTEDNNTYNPSVRSCLMVGYRS